MTTHAVEAQSGEKSRHDTVPRLSLLLLLVLLALAPVAMSLEPYPGIYAEGVAQTDHSKDPLYPVRLALIVTGLGVTVVSFVEFMMYLRERGDPVRTCSYAGVLLATFVVGWRSYPYWATGVYQVSQRGQFTYEFDPKNLMPMVWLDELWRLPVLMHLPLLPVITAFLAIGGFYALRERRLVPAVVILGTVVVATGFTLYSPEYMNWLMD